MRFAEYAYIANANQFHRYPYEFVVPGIPGDAQKFSWAGYEFLCIAHTF